ncbi:uncharacterized protein F4817DRAFT_339576 [Daldinia loculata]|uniref:uncharacterized protein n=1 Tax=Daldinia loculata TaxID=103429 RepID=UPI0020C1C2A3|nr:uncharacterized protein F4817DRAFT_339576 [Daldinia loculata]KAI1646837.1 hypothetical protein F4817DRAFT_339576 [Daldinia loculata]
MLASIITPLTFLALVGATPVPQAAQQLSRSKGFHLKAELRDQTKDLDPPVAGTYLSGIHVGAGQNIAVVSASNPGSSTPYYSNGTEAQGWVDVLNDLGTDFPWGFIVQDSESTDATYPGEHDASINVGGGSNGITIEQSGDSVALSGLAPGYYAVCDRFIGYVRTNIQVVRYVYEGETLPENCAAVNFVPQCATLDDLPATSEWTHDFVQEIDCVAPSA